MKRQHKFLKGAGILLLLAAVTFLISELPGRYYAWADEHMQKEITVREYALDVVDEPVSYRDKLKALEDDNVIISTGSSIRMDIDKTGTEPELEMLDKIEQEISEMIDHPWGEKLKELLFHPFTYREWLSVKLIWVQEDRVRSFEIGVLQYSYYNGGFGDAWGEWSQSSSGQILFDPDNDKIISLAAKANWDNIGAFWGGEKFPDDEEDEWEQLQWIAERFASAEVEEHLMNSLEQYYGRPVDGKNEIDPSNIYLSPHPYSENLERTYNAVYNCIAAHSKLGEGEAIWN